jgi:hypothetical protein
VDGLLGELLSGLLDRWLAVWMHGLFVRMDAWLCGWMDKCLGRLMDCWVDGKMSGLMGGLLAVWIDAYL